MKTRKRRRVWVGTAAVICVVGLAAFGARRMWRVQAAENLPSAPARKGEFLVLVRVRGEITAQRSVQLAAPLNVPDLRIVWLATPGSVVKAGEPVIRFDPSSARQQQDEKKAALQQAQSGLEQALAQARITAEQDKRDLAAAISRSGAARASLDFASSRMRRSMTSSRSVVSRSGP